MKKLNSFFTLKNFKHFQASHSEVASKPRLKDFLEFNEEHFDKNKEPLV